MTDAVITDRIQFAFTLMFHYLFPILTMGLAPLIAVLKTLHLLRKQFRSALDLGGVRGSEHRRDYSREPQTDDSIVSVIRSIKRQRSGHQPSGWSSRVTAAHIHVGARGTNGPVVVFFCGGGGRPSCPAAGETVTGTITTASVLAGADIKRGDLPGLMKAITAADTYVNVHTTKYKDGEIRGQIAASM